ncbi:sugar transferase [Priestia aryabhattai]|uniref:sugar transferase n=1 Tax=Priestia aryabhattai TaxID=412384 RepID=UPI00203C7452|nr:sugar transferase [Priestia aryabhattai]MCM3640626.1 sugar transferase [Priestia aryabhattai]MED4013706.1 sugar transferase [Priestia aryabhattai]
MTNKSSNYTPVVLFCYNRPDLTLKTLKALEENMLAKYTDVYVFVDGPKNNSDAVKVEETISIVKREYGFKSLSVSTQSKNKGLAKSIIDGVSSVINKHKKVIVLEDDLITHTSFLSYMNEALTFFEDKSNIWSISGYTPNIKLPENYKSDIFLTLRGSSWGWATWKDRWENVKWEWKEKDFQEFISKKSCLDLIGEDIYHLTKDYKNGFIDSWAIRWTNTQFNLEKFTVFPRYSFIQNEGFGGDSTHGSLNDKFKTELSKTNFKINLSQVQYDKEIEKIYSDLYKLKAYNKIAIILKKIKIYKLTKKLMKKIR